MRQFILVFFFSGFLYANNVTDFFEKHGNAAEAERNQISFAYNNFDCLGYFVRANCRSIVISFPSKKYPSDKKTLLITGLSSQDASEYQYSSLGINGDELAIQFGNDWPDLYLQYYPADKVFRFNIKKNKKHYERCEKFYKAGRELYNKVSMLCNFTLYQGVLHNQSFRLGVAETDLIMYMGYNFNKRPLNMPSYFKFGKVGSLKQGDFVKIISKSYGNPPLNKELRKLRKSEDMYIETWYKVTNKLHKTGWVHFRGLSTVKFTQLKEGRQIKFFKSPRPDSKVLKVLKSNRTNTYWIKDVSKQPIMVNEKLKYYYLLINEKTQKIGWVFGDNIEVEPKGYSYPIWPVPPKKK